MYCCAQKPRLTGDAAIVQAVLVTNGFYTKTNRLDPNYKTSKLLSVCQTIGDVVGKHVASIYLEGTILKFKPGMGLCIPEKSKGKLITSSDFLQSRDAKKFIELFQKFVRGLEEEKLEEKKLDKPTLSQVSHVFGQ
jgi:hypothetical protein